MSFIHERLHIIEISTLGIYYVFTQVSTNGFLVLWPWRPRENVTLPKLSPYASLGVPLLAPFWTNVTTLTYNELKNEMVYRGYVLYEGLNIQKQSRLAWSVNTDIKRKFHIRYKSKNIFTVTWYNVTYAGAGSMKTKVGWSAVLMLKVQV